MARMGQPDRGQGRLRAHPQLQPLRPGRSQGLPAAPRHRRPQRPARHLLGTGQVGRPPARTQDRLQRASAQDQHGRWPRRQVGPLRVPARDGRGVRLHPLATGARRMSAPFTQTFTATPEDIDVLGHVNNVVWVKWMEAIATAHWEAVSPPEHKARYIWMVTRHEVDYRGNIREGETVTAETEVGEAPKGAQMTRAIRFRNAA